MRCEAATLAQLKGDWEPERDETALLVGNYLHSHFESPQAWGGFKRTHPQILASRGPNKGHLKAEYKQADAMIETLQNDSVFRKFYQGKKEVIVQGEIGGVAWMGKLDCLADNHKYFADLKTTQDIHKKFWLPEERRWGTFIEAYNYPIQMAIYQELIRQQYGVEAQPIIVAVTKQYPPDKELISIPQELLDYWLERVIELQPHIEAVKNGEEEPTACGTCEYCRGHKQLTGLVNLYDLLDRG